MIGHQHPRIYISINAGDVKFYSTKILNFATQAVKSSRKATILITSDDLHHKKYIHILQHDTAKVVSERAL